MSPASTAQLRGVRVSAEVGGRDGGGVSQPRHHGRQQPRERRRVPRQGQPQVCTPLNL